jgi:hypothetical protein
MAGEVHMAQAGADRGDVDGYISEDVVGAKTVGGRGNLQAISKSVKQSCLRRRDLAPGDGELECDEDDAIC